ncbi:hypothetical protein [Burkholderia sp. SIMBA_062]
MTTLSEDNIVARVLLNVLDPFAEQLPRVRRPRAASFSRRRPNRPES